MPGDRDDTAANRDQILDAATRVFAEKGYNSARMDDVVASSGLSKGTVYWHYKSKDGLLTAVMRRFLSSELRKGYRIASQEGSVADGLLGFVHQVADRLEHLGALLQLTVEFYAIALRKEWARKILRESYAQSAAFLRDLVQLGIDRGEFRQVSAEDTALALTALIEGMILLWVIDDRTMRIGHHSDAALRLLLDGIRAHPDA